MNTTHLITTLAVFACALALGGCIIEAAEFSSGDFPCASDADCIAARQVCDQTTNTCILAELDEPPPCDDEDGDGYGCNDDRIACEYDLRDTDCAGPTIFPGAADLCDGKDNDSDGTSDEPLDCERISDCPTQNLPDASFFRCEEGTCVLRPADTSREGCDIPLECTDGAYEPVPEVCKN